MGIAYLLMFIIYVFISTVVIVSVKKIFKQSWFTWLTVSIVLLFPTYDIIIQISILKYYELIQQPLQQVTRIVEKPGSVYWEDNVWPGYDENYRLWMIDHLLDGEHLDTLAMNGPDGKIYLYRHGKGDTPEVFSDSASLPNLNYHIKLDPVELWFWQKPFVWGDRIEITDNKSKELIAFSQRYMGYSPRMLIIKARGGRPFEGGKHLGYKYVYYFDEKVIFSSYAENGYADSARNAFAKSSLRLYMMRYHNEYRERASK